MKTIDWLIIICVVYWLGFLMGRIWQIIKQIKEDIKKMKL